VRADSPTFAAADARFLIDVVWECRIIAFVVTGKQGAEHYSARADSRLFYEFPSCNFMIAQS
jgi:hypothetical protein